MNALRLLQLEWSATVPASGAPGAFCAFELLLRLNAQLIIVSVGDGMKKLKRSLAQHTLGGRKWGNRPLEYGSRDKEEVGRWWLMGLQR